MKIATLTDRKMLMQLAAIALRDELIELVSNLIRIGARHNLESLQGCDYAALAIAAKIVAAHPGLLTKNGELGPFARIDSKDKKADVTPAPSLRDKDSHASEKAIREMLGISRELAGIAYLSFLAGRITGYFMRDDLNAEICAAHTLYREYVPRVNIDEFQHAMVTNGRLEQLAAVALRDEMMRLLREVTHESLRGTAAAWRNDLLKNNTCPARTIVVEILSTHPGFWKQPDEPGPLLEALMHNKRTALDNEVPTLRHGSVEDNIAAIDRGFSDNRFKAALTNLAYIAGRVTGYFNKSGDLDTLLSSANRVYKDPYVPLIEQEMDAAVSREP